ncbi:Auxin-responsive protein IAA9 [Abeliophyllum distichum]|uniref:Auxin-responsive protein IAA9 n=1 Tax=Abeliophyllum distichum TaxID=126358 RepID=A0ABD1VVA4_9LAMI
MFSGALPPISPSLEPCLIEHPLWGVEGVVVVMFHLCHSTSMDCISHGGLGLKERNYLGLSGYFLVGNSSVSNVFEKNKNNLNLNATKLRLGLPGSQNPIAIFIL